MFFLHYVLYYIVYMHIKNSMGCVFSVFCVCRSLISMAYRDALDIILFSFLYSLYIVYTCVIRIVFKKKLLLSIHQYRYYHSHNFANVLRFDRTKTSCFEIYYQINFFRNKNNFQVRSNYRYLVNTF